MGKQNQQKKKQLIHGTGGQAMNKTIFTPTEDVEQTHLFAWAAWASGRYPELELMYHIPNGGKRGKAEAARFKAQGVKAGIPDIFLPAPRGGYCGMYIEMKRQEGGKVSDVQQEKILQLTDQDYYVVVCKGFDEAKAEIERYLNEPKRGDILFELQKESLRADFLEKRLKHLLESDVVSMFDEKNISTNDYKLDIRLLDAIVKGCENNADK